MAVAPQAAADRAIVVGIGNYLRYGPGKGVNHLDGPIADATDIAKWLVNSAGADVTLMTSNGRKGESWTIANMRPNESDVETPFSKLVVESLDLVEAGKPSQIGRRLYIYMAGHGFMPEADHVSLVTAESIERDFVRSLQATAWANWFADQYHFDELVLWMDCCAERNYFQPSRVPVYPRTAMRQDRAKMFVAYAAKPSQLAFEGPIGPNGEIRGIFTDKLLKALKGGAADSQGRITSLGVKGYLEGKGLVGDQPVTLGKAEHYVPKYDSMLLATIPVQTPSYNLLVPVTDGATVAILDGIGTEVTTEIVANAMISARLTAGLYKAVSGGWSKVFEIASGSSKDVDLR